MSCHHLLQSCPLRCRRGMSLKAMTAGEVVGQQPPVHPPPEAPIERVAAFRLSPVVVRTVALNCLHVCASAGVPSRCRRRPCSMSFGLVNELSVHARTRSEDRWENGRRPFPAARSQSVGPVWSRLAFYDEDAATPFWLVTIRSKTI